MFSQRGTFILPTSFNPPVLPPLDATSSSGRRPDSPGWVMLHKVAYIGDRKNGTFAQAITRTGQAIGVSLWLTDPPAVSHLCFHLSGLKVTEVMDEPVVLCLGKDTAIIRVAYNLGFRPLESSVHYMGVSDCDYLVYRAHTEPPSLDVLPNPKPLLFHPSETGFFPCGDDGADFLMAVLRPKDFHLEYDLHIFSSQTNAWTTRLALLEPPYPGFKNDDYLVHHNERAITLEGGLLGWVDLWRGILLRSVLDTAPVVRYIRFPKPMDGSICLYREYLQTEIPETGSSGCHLQRRLHQADRGGGWKETGCCCKGCDARLWFGDTKTVWMSAPQNPTRLMVGLLSHGTDSSPGIIGGRTARHMSAPAQYCPS